MDSVPPFWLITTPEYRPSATCGSGSVVTLRILHRSIPARDLASVLCLAAASFVGEAARGGEGGGGEAGHTMVQVDGALCRCGRRGCWETVATLGWLRQKSSELGLDNASEMTAATLLSQVSDGNTVAAGLMSLYARNLAVGMINNEQILASGTYIMHGDVCGGGK